MVQVGDQVADLAQGCPVLGGELAVSRVGQNVLTLWGVGCCYGGRSWHAGCGLEVRYVT